MSRTRDEGQVAEAARLYHEKGMTFREVAAEMGVDESTARRWLAGTARPRGPRPSSLFPSTLWREAIRAGGAAKDAAEVTVVCPEHEPGGKVLARRASQEDGREAAGRHYRASGHARPWVMDAARWDTLLEMARGI